MALHSPWIVLLNALWWRLSLGTMERISHMSKYNQVVFLFFFTLKERIFFNEHASLPPPSLNSTKNDHISCKH